MVYRATVANLESKVETLTTSNTLIKEELDMAKNSLTTLKEENQLLKNQLIKRDDSQNVHLFLSYYISYVIFYIRLCKYRVKENY